MKSAKLGAMFLISILALAGVGMGYAAWTDTITIDGTINTGNVDIAVRGYSGTCVWKVYGGTAPADELYRWHGLVQDKPTDAEVAAQFGGATVEEIAYAYAGPGTNTDVTMTFDSLFPCIDFYADVIFHYEGNIPAYVYRSPYINIDPTNGPQYDSTLYPGLNWMDDHWLYYQAGNTEGIWIDVYYAENVLTGADDMVTSYTKGEQIFDPVQLHYCDYIVAEVHVHIIQDNIFQSCSGTFDLNVYAIQWNEYGQ